MTAAAATPPVVIRFETTTAVLVAIVSLQKLYSFDSLSALFYQSTFETVFVTKSLKL
jgi:hypothetical protein